MNSQNLTELLNVSPIKRERIGSLTVTATRDFSRRRTIHVVGSPYQNTAADLLKAMKAYRERRASYQKQKTKQQSEFPIAKDKPKLTVMLPIDQFRRCVRLVMILLQAFKNIVFYASEKGKHKQISSETTLTLKATSAKGTVENLLFDPDDFKSEYKNTLPPWARQLAETSPEERSDQKVKLFVRLMKQLKGFRRYSSQVQYSFCRVLKYDHYCRRRVIIRKGHVAQRVYFIFSGSVSVTVDDDGHSEFGLQEVENFVLQRGDYFGELAFLRNDRRAATVVCIEKTELLSMEKEDFLASGVNKCFAMDTERRVDFLRRHPLFVTWSIKVLRNLSEVSRIHEYNSDDVVVRNSQTSSWLIFILKGQCDILRLLDLSSCDAYVKHCNNQNRKASVRHNHLTYPSPNLGFMSPDSFMLKTGDDDEEDEDAIPFSSSDFEIRKRNVRNATTTNNNRTKSAYSRTTNHPEAKSTDSDTRKTALKDDFRRDTLRTSKVVADDSMRTEAAPDGVGLGVYMVVDRLKPGQFFGSWSIIHTEDRKIRSTCVCDERKLILLSGGCEVIKFAKESFQKHADHETIEKLRHLSKTYPSDNELCRTYLKISDWRTYREDLVEHIMEKRVAEKEMSTRLRRSSVARAAPVPSPLISIRPWQPAKSADWEYFPGTGWMSSRAAHPGIADSKDKDAAAMLVV